MYVLEGYASIPSTVLLLRTEPCSFNELQTGKWDSFYLKFSSWCPSDHPMNYLHRICPPGKLHKRRPKRKRHFWRLNHMLSLGISQELK
jgi:hypothetical protein